MVLLSLRMVTSFTSFSACAAVVKPITHSTSPTRTHRSCLWTNDFFEGGESWSTPVVAKMDINSVSQNTDKAVVVIGGGYDSAHDITAHPSADDALGSGIYMLDLVSGAQLWRAGLDNSGADLQLAVSGREMDRAIPNAVRVIDLSGDG